ncbi:GNAT family N-acetyltransferase [Amnibacterium kyonggiense]|uniref:Ribosomal-protein-serine acetyltransferase n=1 Tax=Amnibacterium kyonggiense TaxID=595671 RepID=A0A4R7FF73_9MICO|nr:GNAT family protein [Amnibacterium kyonggiense]TDS76009.1 ribosomal-protein-serine acetyltransferase [Amnibacterium kyonggiense]
MSSTAPLGAFFAHRCAEDVDLVLRELFTTVEMHELVVANLERLRRWEEWAQPEPTLPRTFEYTRRRLDDFVAGRALPCAIRFRGELVGAVELDIDPVASTGAIGVWVSADAEGRGVARSACEAVLDHAFGSARLTRVEARIATANTRSRRLAEQLGFTLEGTLRRAHQLGGEHHDLAVYGMLAEDREAVRSGARRTAA